MAMTGLSTEAKESWTGWFCLTVRERLDDDGSHITVDLPTLSVTVQNFRGVLRGFVNACSHRGTQMREAGCGHGPLRCPYHGWVYNVDGVPVGVPDNELLFGLDRAAREALALRPVVVATWGHFVFAAVDPGTEALTTALGSLAAMIAALPAPGHPPAVVDRAEGEILFSFRNLTIRAAATGSVAEITLPRGGGGLEVDCFGFAPAR